MGPQTIIALGIVYRNKIKFPRPFKRHLFMIKLSKFSKLTTNNKINRKLNIKRYMINKLIICKVYLEKTLKVSIT